MRRISLSNRQNMRRIQCPASRSEVHHKHTIFARRSHLIDAIIMSPASGSESIVCSASLKERSSGASASCASSSPPFLKAKFQIGSVKGPKVFTSNQTVFHRDDVPAASRERKKEIKEWKERRVLARGKPPGWVSSVSLDVSRLQYTRIKSNSEHDPGKPYQYSYRAETLPPKTPESVPKPHRFKVSSIPPEEIERRRAKRAAYPDNTLEHPKRVAELPVNPRLRGKTAWDSSSQLDARDRRRRLEELEAACWLSSMRKNRQLRAYTAPEQREKEKREWIRELKRDGMLWKLKEREPAPLPPTHNRLAKDPIRRMRVHRHSGKWAHSEAEGCYMWSDTASFVFDSPGDVVRVHNPTGFNFASPCLTHG